MQTTAIANVLHMPGLINPDVFVSSVAPAGTNPTRTPRSLPAPSSDDANTHQRRRLVRLERDTRRATEALASQPVPAVTSALMRSPLWQQCNMQQTMNGADQNCSWHGVFVISGLDVTSS